MRMAVLLGGPRVITFGLESGAGILACGWKMRQSNLARGAIGTPRSRFYKAVEIHPPLYDTESMILT